MESDETMSFILVNCFAAYVIYLKYLQFIDWFNVFLQIGIIIVTTLFIFLLIYSLYKAYKNKKEKTERLLTSFVSEKNTLLNLLGKDFYGHSYEIKEKVNEINEKLKRFDKDILAECDEEIRKFNKKAEEKYKNTLIEEEKLHIEEESKIKKKEKEQIEFDRQVSELFEFKKAKNSVKTLPLDKKYSVYVIEKAKEKMDDYLRDEKNSRRIRNEAIEYYRTNDLDTKPWVSWIDEPIYTKVREDIKEGKIDIHEKGLEGIEEDSGPKLQSNFYRAKELDEETKKRAIKQGFRFIHGIDIDGKLSSGGFYIKKENTNETDYHFYMKYLFKELNENMEIEYGLEGKRVDIALISKKLRLGIEIETNKNKDSQLTAKIPWLNKNFDKWIFVCPRNALKRYEKLVDWNKSFCFTTKKAKEKVLELLAAI